LQNGKIGLLFFESGKEKQQKKPPAGLEIYSCQSAEFFFLWQ